MNQEVAQLACPTHHFSVQLSPTPRAARLARLLAVEQLRTWELVCVLDGAAHIVAELAANAVTHARLPGRDFRLVLYVAEGVLRIEVADARGDRRPQLGSGEGESGRGLILVEALADRWGVTAGPAPRKTVWAEIDLSPGRGNACSGHSGFNPKGTSERERNLTKPHPSSRRHSDG
ncbi:ATP-binding protein [Streptomyces sp. VRA16 Mangrove soil]|uniref:ATP-binding protein n=1 Tax=Streptomyces sp. VRA16 Mangrove soil TaxID=2817434 RepID=UPI001A9D7DF5|nr:ATP-binding protein [Streptomyces sp. VRA16 Mangrove soil]MBO1333651.1 ATP-binding protein [Streptomyces sp. VRA16 Mangrove soil]